MRANDIVYMVFASRDGRDILKKKARKKQYVKIGKRKVAEIKREMNRIFAERKAEEWGG